MVDLYGTLVGFLAGAGLILFGIAWPGPMANGCVCRIAAGLARLNQLKHCGVPRGRMEALAAVVLLRRSP